MAVEAKRGCGYRKVGGLYLCGGGVWTGCDRLPFELKACPACGGGIHFPRAPREIDPGQLFGYHEVCRDINSCRMCQPQHEIAYLLGVGEKFYTPQEFLLEAQTMGVSKRIPAIPKSLKVGETWIYLVHRKAIKLETASKPIYKMAIFAAFVPQKVEMPIWKADATEEKLAELQKRGITPVIIPDGDPDHQPTKRGK
ncbi:MAG: hypothetical protein Q7T57_02750 [Dehalococcoidales bacterium]|nr:hypothetical protein [Dehalococcoidales bacterium]